MAVDQARPAEKGNDGSGVDQFSRGGVLYNLMLTDVAESMSMVYFKKASAAVLYVDQACTLTFYVAFPDEPNVPYPAYDDEGNAVEIEVAAAGVYTLPPRLFAAPLIGMTSSVGGTAVKFFAKK